MADWDQQQCHNIPLGEQIERADWDQQQLKDLQKGVMAMTGGEQIERADWDQQQLNKNLQEGEMAMTERTGS